MIKNSMIMKPPLSGAIQSQGRGVNFLISANYTHLSNWMSFSAWYSIKKNLPESDIALLVPRSNNLTYYYYHWAQKSGVKYFMHKDRGELNRLYGIYIALKEGVIIPPLIAIEDSSIVIDSFSEDFIDKLNNKDFIYHKNYLYFNKDALDITKSLIGKTLVLENDESNIFNIKQNFDNFNLEQWSEGKTAIPFSTARTFQSISSNFKQRRVIDLWSRMGPAYEALNKI